MVQAAIDDVVAQLADEGIHVSVRAVGEGLAVEVESTEWSWPHTWLAIFLAFLRSGYCVTIR